MKAPVADAVSKVLKELLDSRDQPVLEEAEAKKVLEDLKGSQVPKELRDSRDVKDPQVPKELMGC